MSGGIPLVSGIKAISIVLVLLHLYAPTGAGAIGTCPKLLALLISWSCIPSRAGPPTHTEVAMEEAMATMAGLVAVDVCQQALNSGGGRLSIPASLRSTTATARWAAMAANRQSLSLAAIGTRLAALCDPSACAPVASTDATGWRQPDDLVPFQYLLPKRRDDRCWGCGSPTRQPWGEPREAPLRKCSGYRVAVYCGAKCAASSWAGRHRLACKAWRTFAKEVPMLCDEYPSSIHSIDARARACARESLQWDLSGDWRTDWSWPKELAAAVLPAGLTLVEVVVVVDPGAWEVQV